MAQLRGEFGHPTDVSVAQHVRNSKRTLCGRDLDHRAHIDVLVSHLGVLLAGQGDELGARDAYEKAINSGHAEAAPIAAASLRAIVEGQEDAQSSEGPGRV